MTTDPSCKFCTIAKADDVRRFGSVVAFLDGYPVTEGHTLVIPVEHRDTYFDLSETERRDTHTVLATLREEFAAAGVTDFNVGWNAGEAAGQTVGHAHCHLIPRRPGDMDDPTGGVRGVIPWKRTYTKAWASYMTAMTSNVSPETLANIERFRSRSGKFGAQHRSAPDVTLRDPDVAQAVSRATFDTSVLPALDEAWRERYAAAERHTALPELVEQERRLLALPEMRLVREPQIVRTHELPGGKLNLIIDGVDADGDGTLVSADVSGEDAEWFRNGPATKYTRDYREELWSEREAVLDGALPIWTAYSADDPSSPEAQARYSALRSFQFAHATATRRAVVAGDLQAAADAFQRGELESEVAVNLPVTLVRADQLGMVFGVDTHPVSGGRVNASMADLEHAKELLVEADVAHHEAEMLPEGKLRISLIGDQGSVHLRREYVRQMVQRAQDGVTQVQQILNELAQVADRSRTAAEASRDELRGAAAAAWAYGWPGDPGAVPPMPEDA